MPNARSPIATPAGPAGAAARGIPPPTRPPSGVITMSVSYLASRTWRLLSRLLHLEAPFAAHDSDASGPAAIDRRDHFSRCRRPGTRVWSAWYERAIRLDATEDMRRHPSTWETRRKPDGA